MPEAQIGGKSDAREQSPPGSLANPQSPVAPNQPIHARQCEEHAIETYAQRRSAAQQPPLDEDGGKPEQTCPEEDCQESPR